MSDLRAALVAEARSWIGTPFARYGRAKGRAADCIFLEEVGRAVGVYAGRNRNYSLQPAHGRLRARAEAELLRRWEGPGDPRPALVPGRLALFHFATPTEPHHFGLIAPHPALAGVFTVIHAASDRFGDGGRVVEHSLSTSPRWLQRVSALYDFPGVD